MSVTTPASAPTQEPERPEPPFSVALVEEPLKALDKAVRAYQLYLRNNPIYQRQLEQLKASFGPLWHECDGVTLQVSDTEFRWYGAPVHQQAEKASDALPWLFFKDGVRELTFERGVESDEIEQLVAIIPRVRTAKQDEDDLLTILWEHEFQHIKYKYVDLAAGDGVATIAVSDSPGKWPAEAGAPSGGAAQAIEDAKATVADEQAGGAPVAAPRPGVVNLDDFDATLYFLDEQEIAYIKGEIGKEYAADLRGRVLDALLDIFELQAEPLVREEVLRILDTLILYLLSAAQFGTVGHLLRELPVLDQRARDLQPAHRDRLRQLPDRLSKPETLAQVLQQLDEAAQLPAPEDLTALFEQLKPSALATIFEWLARTQNARLRPLLEAAADRLAAQNTSEVVRLIASGEGPVAMEAVRRAGALKSPAAVAPLGKVLGEPYRDLRLAAVAALVEIGSPGALQALERALDDLDRDVRLAAVRAIGAKGHKNALARMEAAIKAKQVRDADLTERMAYFETFGALCGEAGIPYLDGLLNGKSGLLGRREDPEVRACAAIALGRIGTRRAQESLQKALAEKDVIVRNAVSRALKGTGA